MKIKSVLFITLLPIISNAGEVATISNFKLWATTNGNDTIRITEVGTIVNPGDLCTDSDSYMVRNTLSPEAKQRIFSSLLAATLANKSIEVFVEGCEQNRPSIVDVRLK